MSTSCRCGCTTELVVPGSGAAVELTAARNYFFVKQFSLREFKAMQAELRESKEIVSYSNEGFAVSYHATFSRITELSLKEWLRSPIQLNLDLLYM